MTLEIHVADAREAVATLGAVVIRVINTAQTDIADIDRIAARLEAVLERASVAGVWVVIDHGAPLPTMRVGRYGARVFEVHRARVSVVYTMLGLGFWKAAARRATAMANKLTGTSVVEASVEASARRLAMDLIGVNPEDLIRAYDQLRAHMQAAAVGAADAAGLATNSATSSATSVGAEPEPAALDPAASASASRSWVGKRSMTRPFRIIIDEQLCDGQAMCVDEAPELFTLVNGKARLVQAQADPKLWFKAEAACRFCPQRALTIEALET